MAPHFLTSVALELLEIGNLYANVGAANVAPLQALEREVLNVVNAPAQTVFGRPLIGSGANATTPVATVEMAGGNSSLIGNGGAGAAGGIGGTGSTRRRPGAEGAGGRGARVPVA